MHLLEIENLSVKYGPISALSHFSLQLAEGEIVTILGPNGAGKSSLLNALAGAVRPSEGTVKLDGVNITRLDSPGRVSRGLVLVPEGRRVLVSMSVHDNLLMGAWCRRSRQFDPELDAIYDRFPNLARRRDMPAAILSGGEQQMLAIGRALMAKPRVMLLDEPSLGLSPLIVSEIFSLVRDLNRDGLSIVLVEQNIHKALTVASRGVVLSLGKSVLAGDSEQLKGNSAVAQAYLGGDATEHELLM